MSVIFATPAGWWALLGIPVVLAIHFLQRQSRRVVTSTLFLLDQLSPVSAQGRRVERLRNSVPLWLQLLAVLLIAWLLAQPRWLRSDSTQTVAVVLDSSISMKVWREPVIAALTRRLGALSGSAAHTEWVLVESDLTKPTLYSGRDLSSLLARLGEWKPTLGAHDPTPALRVAQSLLRRDGVVIFATDHAQPLPEGVRVLATGLPFDNVGFIGLRVEDDKWTALIRNHGATAQTRSWWIENNRQPGPRQKITLDPGQASAISGRFPAGAKRLELALDADLFDSDDRLPIVREEPKRLRVAMDSGTPLETFFKHLADSFPNAFRTAGEADLRLVRYDPLAPAPVPPKAIVMLADTAPSKAYLAGPIVAQDHPLVEGLSWQGLLCRDTLSMPAKPGDEVLLWQGDRPLIWLRGTNSDRSLVVNFDIRQSNADRLPAFVVLLNRFAEEIRRHQVAPESVNAETNQQLAVATRADGGALEVKPGTSAGGTLRAPGEPGFFEVTQDGVPLVTAAAHFADPREADFRNAVSIDTVGEAVQAQARRSSREDFFAPAWALLLGVVLLANWNFCGRSRP